VLAVLPAAMPGVFIGIGFLLAFNQPPLVLGGTAWILILALTFWHIPFGYQAATAGLKQIDRSIEEAAADLGASGLRVLTDVYLPLLRGAFAASFVTAFIRAVTNLSIVVFLVTPRNLVATYSILSMISGGFWGAAAALTTALLGVTFLAVPSARLAISRGLRGLAGCRPPRGGGLEPGGSHRGRADLSLPALRRPAAACRPGACPGRRARGAALG